MRRSLYALTIAVVLLTIGFVVFNSARSRTIPATDSESGVSQDMPLAIPTALSDLPDIEFIPIYPKASVIKTTNKSVSFRQVVYEAGDSFYKIDEFYRDKLAKRGWRFLNSDDTLRRYDWSDPSGKSPWHLYLDVVLGLTSNDFKTFVNLNYGRYPDIGDGMPVYPDAQQVAISRSEKEEGTGSERIQVHITDKTYLSNASPQDITKYYDGSLLEGGWYFFEPGTGPSDTQTGDITSQDGLYYVSQHKGANPGTTLISDLTITATSRKDGLTLITMHVEEVESPNMRP
ncbi:MAG: hypothetical protein ABI670_13795 [Chloroflexota bacterium]